MTCRHKVGVVLAAAAATATATVLTATSAAAAPPQTIVPWTKIGGIGLGMVETRVAYEYGTPDQTSKTAAIGSYPVPGGRITVLFHDGRVVDVSTTSARYSTPGGIHVGLRIPLRRLSHGRYRWHGFTLNPEGQTGGIWMRYSVGGGRRLLAKLYTGSAAFGMSSRPAGVISEIEIETY